ILAKPYGGRRLLQRLVRPEYLRCPLSSLPRGLSLLIQYVPLVADENIPLLAVGGDGGPEDRLRDRFLNEMRRAIGQTEIDAIPKAQFGQRFFGVVHKVCGLRPGNGVACFDDEESLCRAVGEIAD